MSEPTPTTTTPVENPVKELEHAVETKVKDWAEAIPFTREHEAQIAKIAAFVDELAKTFAAVEPLLKNSPLAGMLGL